MPGDAVVPKGGPALPRWIPKTDPQHECGAVPSRHFLQLFIAGSPCQNVLKVYPYLLLIEGRRIFFGLDARLCRKWREDEGVVVIHVENHFQVPRSPSRSCKAVILECPRCANGNARKHTICAHSDIITMQIGLGPPSRPQQRPYREIIGRFDRRSKSSGFKIPTGMSASCWGRDC